MVYSKPQSTLALCPMVLVYYAVMPRPRPNPYSRQGPRKPKRKPQKSRPLGPAHEYEVEALAGLEEVVATELSQVPHARDIRGSRFWFPGDPTRLTRMRSPIAFYRIKTWDISRPKGLLGHQQLGELADFLRPVIEWGKHKSFRLGAAGKESTVMRRLADELESALNVPHQADEGELLIRLRPSTEGEGWDVLARMTTEPLSSRTWRVCNRSGGLNATIAYAALKLAGQREQDRILNPMCGSGTLLIERSLMGPYDAMVGVDIDAEAVACAQTNLKAAGRKVEVAHIDALHTELPDRSFDLVVADLPWGDAIGTHESNQELYPAFFKEMHRLTSKRGRVCIITHEIRLTESILREQNMWNARELFQVSSGGHHPKGYLLQKG